MPYTKRVFSFLIMAVLIVGVGPGCIPAAEAAKTYTITVGGTVPDDHSITRALVLFKNRLEETSKGQIAVNVFSSNQLGGTRELLEGLQMGTVQMTEGSIAAMAVFTNKLTPLSLPFLFPSREAAFEFADGAYAKELCKAVQEETGLQIVAFFENGIRQFTNAKRPVRTPEDMKGMKVRVMESPIFLKTFESIGASPMPMAFAELYTALQQKTIDGQDNPAAIVVSNKFYEIQDYFTTLRHCFDYTIVLVNQDFYASLPDELKKQFDEAMAYATAEQRKMSRERENEFFNIIRSSVKEFTDLTDSERAVFRDRCMPVYDWYRTTFPDQKDNLERILKELEEISKK